MRLTKAQRRVLEWLRDAEDSVECASTEVYPEDEIVCEGLVCYIGLVKTSWQTVRALLRLTAISDESDHSNFRRFALNETGRNILADETQIDVLLAALHKGGSWTWCDGKLVEL